MEEVHRVGVATVLTTDADLESGPCLAAFLDSDLHQTPDTLTVQGLERRDTEDALVQVAREERRLHVVAREAPGGLGQVVGAEGEELRGLGDRPCGQRRPGQLDHGADQMRDVHPGGGMNLLGYHLDPVSYTHL